MEMSFHTTSRRWVQRFVAVVAAGALGLSAAAALAADVTFTADTDLPLTTQGITLTILSGGEATSLTVNADNIVVIVPTSSSLSVRNLDQRPLTNDQSLTTICHPSYSQLDITGPKTITITPASSGVCTATTTATGGGGGSGSTPPAPLPTTPPTITTPPVTTPPTTSTPPTSTAPSLEQLTNEADSVDGGSASDLADGIGQARSTEKEQVGASLASKVVPAGTPADVRGEISNFIAYGTLSTVGLGAGERAGVVDSYRAAYGRLPRSVADWNDAIKIANGRWPSATNVAREKSMESAFKRIYLRAPRRANARDDAAVVIMTYGLRMGVRKLGSEKAASQSFLAIYGRGPASASDWDAVRAVAYSGATR